jgi:hypothetical protein
VIIFSIERNQKLPFDLIRRAIFDFFKKVYYSEPAEGLPEGGSKFLCGGYVVPAMHVLKIKSSIYLFFIV